MKPLILASTSLFRRELLGRLGLPFEPCAPDYEEVVLDGLSPEETALQHALGKARSVSGRFPGQLVIGSDQLAELDGDILGKPLTEARAVAQLRRMAGRKVWFHTGLALVRDGEEQSLCEPFGVRLRALSDAQIVDYVRREQPLHSAGSFHVEGLGIALMEELDGRDLTSLIGLPLIALTDLLARFGVEVLGRVEG